MSRIGWSDFVVWQCSLRQRNFRIFNGKPSEGTSALLLNLKTNSEILTIKSVLIEKNCLNTAKMFEFMIKKTHDPEERFSRVVKFFASEYYSNPEIFDGSFTAAFPENSEIVKKIIKKKKCIVDFFERDTGFYFPVNIYKLKKSDPKWLYTFYHNSFFNPTLHNNINILYFRPEKSRLIKR